MTGGLVGRDALLGAAAPAVEAAIAGSGGLLLLAGEPGIGKTALLGVLAARVERHGGRVLRGTCWAGGGAPAYWPWTQVLREPAADGVPLGAARRLLGADPAEPSGTGAADAAAARFRLFDAVATALARLADRRPVAVVLDDLQWADEPSLRLVEFVVRQAAGTRLLVLGAYRDDEASRPVRALAGLGRLLPVGGVGQADVPGLMAAAAGPAAGGRPGPVLTERVWRLSGGNPLLVGELARLLLARGGWSGPDRGDVPIPGTVRDTLDRRIARLAPDCATVLAVAALAGPVVRPDLVDAVLGRPGATADVLAEAVASRVLLADGDGHRFAHDLFREALAAALPAARRRELHLALGRALERRRAAGGAAERAAHFLAAGAAGADAAVRHSAAAAREATARLGHEDACRHLRAALEALELLEDPGGARRTGLVLDLADAADRCGRAEEARSGFREAAGLARRAGDPAALARAAIGLHGLGNRSGAASGEVVALLRAAATALGAAEAVEAVPAPAATGDPAQGAGPGAADDSAPDRAAGFAALRAGVLAALSRELRHSAYGSPAGPALAAAKEAVAVAEAVREPSVLAVALLALHDARWEPGTARTRLEILTRVDAAAERSGDRELRTLARQLRATAALELGEAWAQGELAAYAVWADELGHARGHWFATTRRATLALLAGRVDESAELAARGLELGRRIGQPDALGAFGTLTASLGLLGRAPAELDVSALEDDPLQPVVPMLRAWVLAASGRTDEARAAFAGFAADVVPVKHDLEMQAILAATAAAAGSTRQREDAYRLLLPHAGTHVVVGGCAAYSGAVDHHLGSLAAALGRPDDAATHLAAAVGMYERLGVEAWAARARAALRDARARPVNLLRNDGAVWTLAYDGVTAHVPDVKGLHDLAVLVAAPGRPVHVFALLGRAEPPTGADPVLDDRALAAYRARLAELDAVLDAATDAAEHDAAAAERAVLVKELTAAVGLGGRPRRLGDETERARKTVSARIRDALRRIDGAHPALGAHLHAAVGTGVSCVYAPAEPTSWSVRPTRGAAGPGPGDVVARPGGSG